MLSSVPLSYVASGCVAVLVVFSYGSWVKFCPVRLRLVQFSYVELRQFRCVMFSYAEFR